MTEDVFESRPTVVGVPAARCGAAIAMPGGNLLQFHDTEEHLKALTTGVFMAALGIGAALSLARAQTVSGSPAGHDEKEMARQVVVINRGTTTCTTIAMRSPYESGQRGAALIRAAMSSCPWHGAPQTYDEYIQAVMAGAREFDRVHPDAR
jgi:hypothetical protein